jgi:uncharacterized membrane protein
MDDGMCPSCRLAAKIAAASSPQQPLPGRVPDYGRGQASQPYRKVRTTAVATLNDSVESRAIAALGYPLPPLAMLALLDRKQSPALRRQVYQSLAFTGGTAGFGFLCYMMLGIPLLNISAAIILAVLFPVWLVASVVYGIKTYNGEDVRIPIISDWIDERMPLGQ